MALIVQKYGGTSMGTPERIENVAKRVKRWFESGNQVVVVVSAMSGETNRLIGLAKAITDTPSPREMDQMLSTGEQVSIALLAMALEKHGVNAQSMTGAQVGMITDESHTKARIQKINTQRIRAALSENKVLIVAGFQGVNEAGDITTLGRGGSDTSGVALAAALGADECQIYTDVDGVYTTDPRVAPKAKKLSRITCEEMLEMASLGSKVLQIRSVEFAQKYKVPLRVLSSFDEPTQTTLSEEFNATVGTLITDEMECTMEQPIISGIAFNRDEAKIVIRGVPDKPGIASQILSPVGAANIEIDMIVQNVSAEGLTDFTFTVNRSDYQRTLDILNAKKEELGAAAVSGDQNVVKVSLVGVGMRSHAGVASKMFDTLSQEQINIQMISTSEIKISVVVLESDLDKAVTSLHTAFGLDRTDGESKAHA